MVNNIDRAGWAQTALEAFASQCMPGPVCKETIIDLICDIGHFAELELKLRQEEVVQLYETGIGSWSAESRLPLGEPMNNDAIELCVPSFRNDG